ncbi:unnamed protein product [Sphagnum jensenii]|uniref:Cilia- and flagella-associated protein 299 n=1 Tax=Sphagnum jensenii TaxID=128206 RepID=A0ABP0W264_9BRYO
MKKIGGPKAQEFPAFTATAGAAIVNEFDTYEDYLDSQITPTDLFYLEDLELARQLVEMGYRSNAEIMSRVDFGQFKEIVESARMAAMQKVPKKHFSSGKDVSGYPFLLALQEREKPVRDGKLATVIFIRDFNSRGHEISGYIDYAERMRTDDLEPVFLHKCRFLPKEFDLSYYNWETKIAISNTTANWQVIAENETGVVLKNKKDRKVLNVNPTAGLPGDNSTRTSINSGEYKQIVIFDHVTRRKL